MKNYKYYDLILGAYVCVLLCANIIGPAKAATVHVPVIGDVTFGAGVSWTTKENKVRTFDIAAVRNTWVGSLMLNHFILTAPWQATPAHDEVTVRVTFHDELSGRVFAAQKLVKINLPAIPAAASAGR